MITQIEIDGFKTFKDFKVELAPFQVIVGPNGSGKSNLFDALQLLSRLMEDDLATAFQEIRGYSNELFTTLSGGGSLDRMKFAVEMLVDHNVQDDYGKSKELKYTRLRYELEIMQKRDIYGLERLFLTHESLQSIPEDKDLWRRQYGVSNNWIPEEDKWIPTYTFVSTSISNEGKATISMFIEEHPYEARGSIPYLADAAQRTVLSSANDIMGFSHAFAAREELQSFKSLHLNPKSLRKSSPAPAHLLAFLSQDGSNLPTMLARMQIEDEFALTDVSRDMANLVPGIFKIRVERNLASNEYDIWAETSDRRTFSAQALSDGTLRLLALAAIRNDTRFHGILCLEEPENGVEPLHLKTMARVLREMATDFSDSEQRNEPLRQVLITTHSPTFISLPDVINSLLFAHIVTMGGSDRDNLPQKVTRMNPVFTSRLRSHLEKQPDKTKEIYTIDMVREYLATKNFNQADNKLKKARMLSIEQ